LVYNNLSDSANWVKPGQSI